MCFFDFIYVCSIGRFVVGDVGLDFGFDVVKVCFFDFILGCSKKYFFKDRYVRIYWFEDYLVWFLGLEF